MKWYWIMAGIIGTPILIAIVVLAWKMIVAGISPDKRSEVKDNIMRLFFGACAIGIAPVFVKLMLLLNNSLVKLLVANAHGRLDDLLGNSILTNINTGNAIATAIVIAMFAYLFVKVNIKFIIREFTLIVFIIFTPIVSVFWILNKRTIASSIWFGQIIINAFMQFIYSFLFLLYLTFLPNASGWATSLLWAMMILPLADALQNTMQNLVSRVAGVNNEELATRGIGMGAAMGYTVKSIAYQFKGNNQNGATRNDIISRIVGRTPGKENIASSLKGMNINENAVNVMGNATNIMEGNINSASNTSIKSNTQRYDATNFSTSTVNSSKIENNKSITNNNDTNNNSTSIKKAYNVGKEFLNLGMYMSDGKNFRNTSNNVNKYKKTPNSLYEDTKINNEERKTIHVIPSEIGDDNEKK